MTRNVFALLITTQKHPRNPLYCGVERIRLISRLLEEQFPENFAGNRLVGAAATAEHLVAAVKHIADRAQNGDLVVLVFVGHGYLEEGVGEGWTLYDGRFSDGDIAQCLGSLRPGVETFVVSDACYGAGAARAGQGVAKSIAGSFSKHLVDEVARRQSLSAQSKDTLNSGPVGGLVCIASARATQRTHVCSDFIPELVKAIPQAETYRELPKLMRNPSVQTDWVVVGVPDSLLDLPPLEP